MYLLKTIAHMKGHNIIELYSPCAIPEPMLILLQSRGGVMCSKYIVELVKQNPQRDVLYNGNIV